MTQPSGEVLGGAPGVGAGNIILLILVMVAILFAAYYTTRLVSGKASRMLRSNKMHIIDRLAISRDKMLLIVRVGDEFHFLGVSNNQINHLANIPIEALEEPEPEERTGESFWSRFTSAMKENLGARVGRAHNDEKPDSYGDIDSMAELVRKRNKRFDRHDGGEE